MTANLKTTICFGIAAFVIGFCFVAGAYVAHDLFRSIKDDNVVWLVNRAGAAVVITLFVALGFIIARAVEYLVVRWWKHRHKNNDFYND